MEAPRWDRIALPVYFLSCVICAADWGVIPQCFETSFDLSVLSRCAWQVTSWVPIRGLT
jgi:hypothetical protein